MVIPLTEGKPAEPSGRPATDPPPPASWGVLVVLDEPWYEVGGLSERLEAEVVLTDGRSILPGLLELGPDPTRTESGPPAIKLDDIRVSADEALGHTFDSGTGTPLLTATSFFLEIASKSGIDLSWYFAQVRFRRKLTTAGGVLTSEPTPPFRFQLLPDSAGGIVG